MSSTVGNDRYLRSNYCASASYDVIDSNGVRTIRELDPLSPKFHEFLERLTAYDIVEYKGQQFTTMVYQYYGNTTLIWLVLLYNGLLSRTELRVGMMLKFPYLAQIHEALEYLPVKTSEVVRI
jgi:hypothetical protein